MSDPQMRSPPSPSEQAESSQGQALTKRILVAGMGSVLRGDDGFGVAVAKRLGDTKLPEGVEVMDVGTGGMSLVQKLEEACDALIIVDAVKRGGKPGTIYVIEPAIPEIDPASMDLKTINYLADEHYVEPAKVLALVRGLGRLPPKVLLVGCEPTDVEEFHLGLSEPVRRGVEEAANTIQQWIVAELRAGTFVEP